MAFITKSEFARRHGFSKQYVTELIRTGVIQETNGKLDEDDADYSLSLKQAMGREKRAKNARRSDLQELYIKAKLKNEIEKGKILKLEAAEKSQSLIPADQVRETLFRKGRVIRDALLSLPDRVASMLEMQNARTIHTTLMKEIRAILEDLSNG